MVDPILAVAPMLDRTDRHFRCLMRLVAPKTWLYTEMVTTPALLRGDPHRHLHYSAAEHPVALQLGGSDPDDLARCARLGEQWGYDAINLNVGCPSDRVAGARFGASLMAEPERVADCVAAMREAVSVPVTVKHRIGIDDQDDYPALRAFVDTVATAGCTTFIVHARKAWLQGLSPKENRTKPPLRHELVHALKAERPDLTVITNGGLTEVAHLREQLAPVDGVMVGRAAFDDPWLMAEAETALLGSGPNLSRTQVVERYHAYAEAEHAAGTPLTALTAPLLGLFRGQPGARAWRRHLSESAPRPGAGPEIIAEALARVASAA